MWHEEEEEAEKEGIEKGMVEGEGWRPAAIQPASLDENTATPRSYLPTWGIWYCRLLRC